MNCNEFDEKISLYIDGKLNKDEEKSFLDHVNDCRQCFRALENTKGILGSLEDLNNIKAPEDLSKSIINALEMEVMKSKYEKTRKGSEESTENSIVEDEYENVQKNREFYGYRKNPRQWFLKQNPWIKKVSLAAVLILIVTSTVILNTDWAPSPIQEDMMVMDSEGESDPEERPVEESEEISDSVENEISEYPQRQPGITAMEDEETAFGEDSYSREDQVEESELRTMETEESKILGVKYREWIVLLLGIGVITVIVVPRKNRKN